MNRFKSNHLTKVSLFKNNFCKSWAYLPKTGQVVIHQDTPATNWFMYIRHNQIAGASGTGYLVKRYQRGFGIKGAQVFKPKQPILNPDLIADKSKPAWIQKTL